MTLGERQMKRSGQDFSSHGTARPRWGQWPGRAATLRPHILMSIKGISEKSSLGESVDGIGVDGLGLLLSVALVKLHELGQIELGLLENLDLLDHDVLEREDLGALLGDLLDDGVGQAKMIYYLLT